MPDTETLREAVEAQARALVKGDLATFASYAAPQALSHLYRSPRERARRYDILNVDAVADHGRSEVRFRGTESYTMRAAWERTAHGWKAVALEIPGETVRSAWWRRIVGRSQAASAAPERTDLS